jgi:hypothetical protein
MRLAHGALNARAGREPELHSGALSAGANRYTGDDGPQCPALEPQLREIRAIALR